MGLLSEKDKQAIRERLASMENPVKLVNFTQELECQFCRETRMLVEELADLSDKITLEKYNFVTDKQQAEKYGIDKIPATIVMSPEKDYGIRFYGIPSGYEFATLLEDILMVSRAIRSSSRRPGRRWRRSRIRCTSRCSSPRPARIVRWRCGSRTRWPSSARKSRGTW